MIVVGDFLNRMGNAVVALLTAAAVAVPRRTGRGKRTGIAVVALLAVTAGTLVSSPAVTQETAIESTTLRIVARKIADGRVEFGIQQRHDDTWGSRQLPRVRFFPTTAQIDRWLVSSASDLPIGQVRIVARKLASGRIEFGIQQRHDDTWGSRQLPRVRFFPTTAQIDRWLVSSPLRLAPAQSSSGPAVDPPPQSTDRYSAISSGNTGSCALRSDGTVRCWAGDDPDRGARDAPGGRFTSVSSGLHSCGLRTDGTIDCWRSIQDGSAAPHVPRGRFSAVTTGMFHSCGLRTDGAIACWGTNDAGQTDAPDGLFTAVSAGSAHSCGLRTDATIACWGANDSGQSDTPRGQFTAVSAGDGHSCGLHTDATIACWGANDSGQSDAPDGLFTAVSAGSAHSCGLRTDATIACWGTNREGQSDASRGQFTAISAGGLGSCGLRTGGAIACWGWDVIDL